jgi:DNA-binding MarR family transcriptional regulator
MTRFAASSGPRYAATLQLLRTAETVWNGSRLFFARWDLSPSQFNILNVLRDRSDGWSQIELSRQLIMHRSNVTGLVDRLEARGLVQRRETPGDRRTYRVLLTTTGAKLLAEILPSYHQAAQVIWADLPLRRARQLERDLAVVQATAERIAGHLKTKSDE